MVLLSQAFEYVEMDCRCGRPMTAVQKGAGYYNRCSGCGYITVGIAGQRPVIRPSVAKTERTTANHQR